MAPARTPYDPSGRPPSHGGAPSSPRFARSPQALTRSGGPGSSPSAETNTDTPAGSASKKPSRKIPAAIRRAVWERDGGWCGYSSRAGRRCGSREFLEFHHQVPWARCREHRASNIHLRCRAHNQLAAELDFGAESMAVYRKRGSFAAGEADPGERPLRDSNWIRIQLARGAEIDESKGAWRVVFPIEWRPAVGETPGTAPPHAVFLRRPIARSARVVGPRR